jgi:uncharacterized membrane protein YphA (DoxX/SURF4 family)
MIRNKRLLFVIRLVVGGVFVWAGLLKVFDPLGFAQNIKNYKIFSHDISFFLALALPWIEVICGAFLIFGIWRRASSFLTSILLAGFVALVCTAILRGIDTDCGCFGSLSGKADFKLVLLDCILLLFSLNLFLSKPK